MRLQVVFSLLVLALVASAQEQNNRREKLRRLIQAARSGDTEARHTLKNIRDQLKSRSLSSIQNVQDQEPVVEALPFQTPTFRSLSEPQHIAEEPQQETHFQPAEPVRQPRVRSQSDLDTRSSHDPHRAINHGLEVDNRSELNANIRVTNETRTPPVETIRRFSYFDEQGNYIFGYEAADGSFKEEKRGKNCIVNGKYGYVDPDGIKREFTYVSGNECDPNAPSDPELQGEQQPLPRNDQFLLQTQEQQLSDAALQELKFNRRRQPVQQQQQQPRIQGTRQEHRTQQQQQQPRIQETRQEHRTQQTQRQRPVERPNISPIPRREFEENIPVIPTPTTAAPPLHLEPVEEEPHIFSPPIQEIPVPHRNQIVFRPTPKPLDINFNFDQEFKNLFSNFDADRRAPSRPQFETLPRPRQLPPTPIRALATLPPPPPPTAPPPTQPPQETTRFSPPTTQPSVNFHPNAPPPTQGHAARQLVFDAATGSFKTVPIHNLVTVAPFKHIPSAPRAGGGVPLFNPLPPVPLGTLSINRGNQNFERDFANFFSNFKI